VQWSGKGYVPEQFTLAELQSLCEALLGRSLDKSSFRRRLDDRGLVEQIMGLCVLATHIDRPRFTGCLAPAPPEDCVQASLARLLA